MSFASLLEYSAPTELYLIELLVAINIATSYNNSTTYGFGAELGVGLGVGIGGPYLIFTTFALPVRYTVTI